jgi:hypothetical protein
VYFETGFDKIVTAVLFSISSDNTEEELNIAMNNPSNIMVLKEISTIILISSPSANKVMYGESRMKRPKAVSKIKYDGFLTDSR